METEYLKRWRMALGGNAADGTGVTLTVEEQRLDSSLEAVYDSDRRGGLGSSAPKVSRWLGDIREFFPQTVVQVIQRDAIKRLHIDSLLTEKEMLVATLMSLGRAIPEKNKDMARQVVRKVVDDLLRKLSSPTQQAVTGALNRSARRRNPRYNEIDWKTTILKNLKNYQPQYKTVIPEVRIGYGRKCKALKDIILCLDQSGSMGTSVVYSGIFGSVLASLPSVSTRMVVFDTSVVDLTDDLQDPVDLLFGVQLGGGTDIARALTYCQGVITRPQDTVLVLVTDLYEGGDEKEMRKRFASIVASTFVGFNADGSLNETNASVAMISLLFIVMAILFGFFVYRKGASLTIATIAGVIGIVVCLFIGLNWHPIYLTSSTWMWIIGAYILVASVAPVWILLQPRDYLNSYLLIFMIVGAVIGVFAANPSCNLKAFTSFNVDGQYMFPILFVTIACGAVSGFHSLVSSGTASKQIKNEKNMLPVSFGAMLMESMLAIIALIAVASFADGEAAAQGLTTQPQIFAGAIANFLSVIGLPHSLVFTLINLAVSAFALTSLDSVARVGRLSFQEFFLDSDTDEENMSPFLKVVTNKYFATIITLVLAYLLTKVGYAEIWPLFGSANQLLSVLALVACAVFLKKTKRQGCMLWIPMVFMMAVTFTALGMTISKLTKALFTTGLDLGNTLQLIFAVLLLILGVLVAIQGVKKLFEKNDEKQTA